MNAARIKDAAEAASEAFWAVVATRFPEIKTGDVSPDMVQEWEEVTRRQIRQWIEGNMVLPDVGDRVRLLREVDRSPHFVAAPGRTGVVAEVNDDGIAVRMSDYLPGSDDWHNAIMWHGDDVGRFYEDCETIDWHGKGALGAHALGHCMTELADWADAQDGPVTLDDVRTEARSAGYGPLAIEQIVSTWKETM